MRLTRSLLVALRVLAAALVIIGVGFWTGHWFGLRPVHMALGTLFVVVLWSLAVIALVARRATGLAVFALVWGAVIAGFGAGAPVRHRRYVALNRPPTPQPHQIPFRIDLRREKHDER